jgi:hypothetical protein
VSAREIRAALRCDRPRCACRRARTVHCPSHPDRAPSFVVDDAGDRILVFCHGGCTQRAVIAALQARHLWPASSEPFRRRQALSPRDEARREILNEAGRQLRRLPLERYAWSDEMRGCDQIVKRARAIATRLGPENETAWTLLEQAAWLETATWAAEGAA